MFLPFGSHSLSHDEVCLVCDEWMVDATDKIKNFMDCPTCPQSYHKMCVSSKYRYRRQAPTCNEIFGHGEYKCCGRRDPQLMFELVGEPYRIEYYRNLNGKKTKPVSKQQRIRHRKYYLCKRYKTIQWKNVRFTAGDSIDIEMEEGHGEIARITDFYVDEEDAVPCVSFTWYWTEKELEAHLLKKCNGTSLDFELPNASKTVHIDKHIYLDLNRASAASMECVNHKVLLCETFRSYKDMLKTNVPKNSEFDDIYYGKWAFDVKYGSYPFARMHVALESIDDHAKQTNKKHVQKENVLSTHNLRKYDKQCSHNTRKKRKRKRSDDN
eukprot:409986_1